MAVMVGSGRLARFRLNCINDFNITMQQFTPPAFFDACTYFAYWSGITHLTDGPGAQEICSVSRPSKAATPCSGFMNGVRASRSG